MCNMTKFFLLRQKSFPFLFCFCYCLAVVVVVVVVVVVGGRSWRGIAFSWSRFTLCCSFKSTPFNICIAQEWLFVYACVHCQ